MSAEGWAWLWLGGVYLVWSGIFVGVVIFALRNDTNIEIDGSDGGSRTPETGRPHPRRPRGGSSLPAGPGGRARVRGAERLAKDRRRRERGTPTRT